MNGLGARLTLDTLDGAEFDVLIVGGGINGCSAAQHLAAEGYTVLLVEKKDFASAASNRSSRLLHCGLRYLAPERTPLEFLFHPSRLRTAVNMAIRSLRARRELVSMTPQRLQNLDMAIPIYCDDAYPGWQVDLGAAFLGILNLGGPPIRYRRQKPEIAAIEHPLVACLRTPEALSSVFSFCDYQFVWPERMCIDALLEAKGHGASVRNYTEVISLEHLSHGGWQAILEDRLIEAGSVAVQARVLLNLTGVWVDALNQLAATEAPPSRKVVAVKGAHIVVRLPERFRGYGTAGLNREKEHMFCLPWGDLHYIGPTETVYEGDIEDVRPTKEDIKILLDQINYMLPKLGVTREDIEFSWAGARPITFDPDRAKGRRMPAGVFHDLSREGMPDAMTVTWGWIMHHRETARKLVRNVRQIVLPSGERSAVSYNIIPFPDKTNTLPLVPECPEITTGVLRHIAEREAPAHLEDILFRRTGLGWRVRPSAEVIRKAAETVADVLDWDEAKIEKEIDVFQAYLHEQHPQG